MREILSAYKKKKTMNSSVVMKYPTVHIHLPIKKQQSPQFDTEFDGGKRFNSRPNKEITLSNGWKFVNKGLTMI